MSDQKNNNTNKVVNDSTSGGKQLVKKINTSTSKSQKNN